MRLAELQSLATSLGITGTAKMRKGDLVTAIRTRQSGGAASAAVATESGDGQRPARTPRRAARPQGGSTAEQSPARTGQSEQALALGVNIVHFEDP